MHNVLHVHTVLRVSMDTVLHEHVHTILRVSMDTVLHEHTVLHVHVHTVLVQFSLWQGQPAVLAA